MANEKGIALVLSLFLLSAMSVIAASLMFLSQTETYSSMNYRLMSQARYGAESGIQRAANHLLYTYVAPATAGADPIANYNTNVSPVTCIAGCPANGQPVVLSADATKAWNYPIPAVQAAFLAVVAGNLPAGNTTVTYAPYATLVSMQQIDVYGGGVQTIQTWQLTSTGTITTGKTAQVEVSATLETPKFPAQMYAAFGTNPGCGTLNFHGNQTQTDSYDSQALVGGNPVISNSGGNVGTNGNLTEGGGADIYGTLSSPRVGVGACSAGNVNALSSSGGATINGDNPPQPGDIIQLPQAVVMPPPTVPAGVPTTAYNGNGQTLLNGASVGDVTINANSTLTLGAPGVVSTININSIKINGNANLVILGTVILNVVGTGQATPIDFTGGSVSNSSFDPTTFQVMYAGAGAVKLNGGAHTTAMVYSPNAAVSLNGGGDFYGSVVGATVDDLGGARLHYDRRLSGEFFVVGNAMMSSFTWKKY
jgi:Tfp pilus assembly protein PilX